MVITKKIDGSNLPKREPEVEKSSVLPSTPPIQNKEAVKVKAPEAIGLEENGGWSVENARRRLNNFCMEERIRIGIHEHTVRSTVGTVGFYNRFKPVLVSFRLAKCIFEVESVETNHNRIKN